MHDLRSIQKQHHLREILKKNRNTLKYSLFVVNIIFMIIAIRTFINYSFINENIERTQFDIATIKERNAYIENYHKKYLQSEFAGYFLGHENNRIFEGEFLISIVRQEELDQANNQKVIQLQQRIPNATIIQPSQQRKNLISEKINRIQ